MDIQNKNRSELKKYFEAGSIPTDANFKDFIDACLNQAEDGIAKAQGSPIALQAEGDSSGTQDVLNLYTSFADANPNWSINLNPRVEANVPGSNKPGLNFKNAAGTSQFFIKSIGGNVGIGTIEPASRLSIQARENNSIISVISETSGAARIFEVQQEDSNGMLSVSAGNGKLISKLSGSESKPSFFLSKVGMGTENPEANLHIKGEAAMLKITNTETGKSPNLNIQGSNGKSWNISNDEKNGNILSINPSEPGESGISIRRDGTLNAMGGVIFGERTSHANQDGAMYRFGGKLYLSIDDEFFIRDVGGNEKVHITSNSGRIAIGGKNPEAPLSISGSGREGSPNEAMHISSDLILFGGKNAGGSAYSGRILVDENALVIVGKTRGTNGATRKVEIVAEGGMVIKGRITSPINFAVAFSVAIDSNSLSGPRTPLPFGHVNFDLGNDFNGTHFTAPVNGLYSFTMTISKASTSGYCVWGLRLNGTGYVNGETGDEISERALLRTTEAINSFSRTVTTQLSAGDKVHIEQTGSSRPDNYASGFEGVLIQAFT